MIARRTSSRSRRWRCAGPAAAQSYPSRVIKLDRAVHAGLAQRRDGAALVAAPAPRLGQPIVIDNKPGGGTTIGTKAAAAAEPDGYTLLFISSALVIDPAMKKQSPTIRSRISRRSPP